MREAICAELEALLPAPALESTEATSPLPNPEAGTEAGTGTAAPSQDADLPAKIRALRARWQQEIALRGVEPARAVALDARFAAAFEKVLAGHAPAFAGTDLDPDANRQRMEALVARIEKLAASFRGSAPGVEGLSPSARMAAMLKEALAANTIGGKVDDDSRMRAAQEDVRQIQASWSRIGPVPEAARRPLADRFQRACRSVADTITRPTAAGQVGRPGGTAQAGKPEWAGKARR